MTPRGSISPGRAKRCVLCSPRRQLILISWGFQRECYARTPLICGMAKSHAQILNGDEHEAGVCLESIYCSLCASVADKPRRLCTMFARCHGPFSGVCAANGDNRAQKLAQWRGSAAAAHTGAAFPRIVRCTLEDSSKREHGQPILPQCIVYIEVGSAHKEAGVRTAASVRTVHPHRVRSQYTERDRQGCVLEEYCIPQASLPCMGEAVHSRALHTSRLPAALSKVSAGGLSPGSAIAPAKERRRRPSYSNTVANFWAPAG